MTESYRDHLADLLPAYAGGSLPAADALRVAAHTAGCPRCASDLADWRSLAAAARETVVAAVPPPPASVMAGVWAEIDASAVGARGVEPPAAMAPGRRVRLLWDLLRGQVPLVRHGIWLASALTMTLGVLVALAAQDGSGAGLVFGLIAPVVAGIGVAFVYGPENDPSLEIALGTPTSPRLVLLARLTLVFGYDLLLALGATLLLAVDKDAGGVWPLVSLWLGPMLFLSGLALVCSIVVGSTTGVAIASGLWAGRLVVAVGGVGRTDGAEGPLAGFWRAEPALAGLGAVLLAIAVLAVPRRERLTAAA